MIANGTVPDSGQPDSDLVSAPVKELKPRGQSGMGVLPARFSLDVTPSELWVLRRALDGNPDPADAEIARWLSHRLKKTWENAWSSE